MVFYYLCICIYSFNVYCDIIYYYYHFNSLFMSSSKRNTTNIAQSDNDKHKKEEPVIQLISPSKSSSKSSPIKIFFNSNSSTPTPLHKQSKFKYSHQFQEDRYAIYTASSFATKISVCHKLIQSNRDKLHSLMHNKLIPSDKISNSNVFRLYLDYIYNFLLLFSLLISSNHKQQALKVLLKLNEETKNNIPSMSEYVYELLNSNNKKYHQDIVEYIKMFSAYVKCCSHFNNNYLYENALTQYITLIENIQNNQMLLSYVYFYTARIFISKDKLTLSAFAYEQAFALIYDYAKRLQAMSLLVSALYNRAIVMYVKGNSPSDIKPIIALLNEAKLIKEKESRDVPEKRKNKMITPIKPAYKHSYLSVYDNINIDQQLLRIYLTLIEIHFAIHQVYDISNDDTLQGYIKIILANSNKLSEKELIVFDYLTEKIEEQIPSNPQSSKVVINERNYLTKNTDDFVKYCAQPKSSIKLVKDVDMVEYQKFFMFIITLNANQIELLNKEQPSMKDMKKYKSLPIYFSNTFKQSLSLEQLEMLNRINTFSLRKKYILKNITMKICVENLDLNLLYKHLNKNNINVEISKLNNYDNIKNKLNQYDNYIIQRNLNSNQKETKTRKEYGFFFRNDSVIDFKYQTKLPYETIKASLKRIRTINGNNVTPYSALSTVSPKSPNVSVHDEVEKDNLIITLLNKMSFSEVKVLMENPEWILEILEEYKEKMEHEEDSEAEKSEMKISEKVEEDLKENEEETYSEKQEEQKQNNKSIELIDAMNMGKDE